MTPVTSDDAAVDTALATLAGALSPHPVVVQTSRVPGSVAVRIAERVTVSCAAADLVAVVSGRADAALLHLAARLVVEGDGAFLVETGSRALLPDGRPLIDARALDPDAVSAAIADVPTDHLDAVMAGAFRELILGEVFGRFPEFLRTEKAARVRLAVAFVVAGRADGGADRYVVEIDRGSCAVVADPDGERTTAADLELSGAQFLRLVLGHLNPVRGVLGGELRVRGELMKALALNSVMRIPGS